MSSNSKTLFGLPSEILFCKNCVISNQRPNSSIEFKHNRTSKKNTINFDLNGICDACRFSEQKKNIDWARREQELFDLSHKFKGIDNKYNCIVPGSGGKDSFFQAHILKYKFGFRPLTVTWAPHIYTDWGWKNFQSWIHAGFDNVLVTPNGKMHRLLTRLAIENLFHPFQPFILGQKNLGPKLAQLYKIPLVFFGENESEYGNPIADTLSPLRSPDYFTKPENDSDIFLGGVSLGDLKKEYKIPSYELNQYLPVQNSTDNKQCFEVHYLGYYLKWHPQSAYYYAVENGGFKASPERTPGTYSKYNSIDDKIDDFHYWTTFIKFGIGRATYDAAQEIRSGDISRDEGVALVKKFDGEWPARFEKEIFEYLTIDSSFPEEIRSKFSETTMSKNYLLKLADNFRSPHLWEKTATSNWQLKKQVE